MKFVVFIYALSLSLRLGFVLLVGRGDLSLDEIEYHMLAANVADGNGFKWFFGLTSTFRPPGYPLLLSVLYFFTGPNYFLARILQSLIAASIPVFAYLLGKEVFDVRVGRLAALFTALYPPLVVHCAALLTENLFIPLLCCGFWLLILSKEKEGLRLHAFASFIIAFAIFVRPSFTFFLPVLCLWIILAVRGRRQAFTRIAMLLGIWLLVVGPWCLRNYNVADRFVYLDTRAGYNLYVGYREGADGSFDMDAAQELIDAFMELNIPKLQSGFETKLTKQEIYRRLNSELLSYKRADFPNHIPEGTYDLSAVESDALIHEWGMKRSREFIEAHPWKALGLLPLKFMSFWNLEHRLFVFAYSQNFLGHLPTPLLAGAFFLLTGPFACLTLLGVFGLLSHRWSLNSALLLVGIIVYYSAMHTVVFGEARLHYPLVPFVALFAASGLLGWKVWVRGRHSEDREVRRATHRKLKLALAMCVGFMLIWAYGIYDASDNIQTIFGPNGNQSRLPF